MAAKTETRALIEKFVGDLQRVISAQVGAEVARQIDRFKSRLVAGETHTRAIRVLGGRMRASKPAELKPCPVCGTPNKARRYSYLCADHRTPENLAKFKGALSTSHSGPSKRAAKTATRAARSAKAPAGTRKGGRKGTARRGAGNVADGE